MIKRIFCYDFNVAKENKNNPLFKRMLIEIFILIVSFIFVILITNCNINFLNIEKNTIIIGYFLLSIVMFTSGALFIDFLISCRKLIGQMTVFITNDKNEILKIEKTNHLDKKMAVGYYIGDKIGGNDSSLSSIAMILAYIFNISKQRILL